MVMVVVVVVWGRRRVGVVDWASSHYVCQVTVWANELIATSGPSVISATLE